MSALVIVEHDNATLHPNCFQLLNAAFELGEQPATVFVVGYQCQRIVSAVRESAKSVQRIIFADAPEYQYFLAENVAKLIAHLCMTGQYTHVLMPATHFGKDILPRVAGLLDVNLIADVVKIIDTDNFVRPIQAGTLLAHIESQDPCKLLTVCTTAFGVPDKSRQKAAPNIEISIESVCPIVINSRSLVKQVLYKSPRPDLSTARIVIAGGRALTAQYFKLLERIAGHLSAAVGATRPAVDNGWVHHDCQIGQTGKTVAPDLYIAVGLSGAMHHVAGVRASKVIVAINHDESAPIFEIADYGLVADLFTALPLLEKALKEGSPL